MKKKILVKFALLFAVMIGIFDLKCYATSDYMYKLNAENQAIITAYQGTNADIVIPASINGYKVIGIEEHAFDENRNMTNGKKLKNVTISEGITYVGDFAFVDCTNLESVTLPETLTSLGDMTFLNCSKLNKINIPSNLKEFRTFVFQGTAFTEFVIPENFEKIGNSDFRLCKQLKSFKVYAKDVVYSKEIVVDEQGNENEQFVKVFEYCPDDLVLYGYEDSTTQKYAEEMGLTFKLLSDEPEEPSNRQPDNTESDSNTETDNTNHNLNIETDDNTTTIKALPNTGSYPIILLAILFLLILALLGYSQYKKLKDI